MILLPRHSSEHNWWIVDWCKTY